MTEQLTMTRAKCERLQRGYSLRRVAHVVGISESYLGGVERGSILPSGTSPVLTALAALYGIPVARAGSLLAPAHIVVNCEGEGEPQTDD